MLVQFPLLFKIIIRTLLVAFFTSRSVNDKKICNSRTLLSASAFWVVHNRVHALISACVIFAISFNALQAWFDASLNTRLHYILPRISFFKNHSCKKQKNCKCIKIIRKFRMILSGWSSNYYQVQSYFMQCLSMYLRFIIAKTKLRIFFNNPTNEDDLFF